MITRYTVWRSHLYNPSEIKGIECCKANTTKIIDNILKNASLKREFIQSLNGTNWLFDMRTSKGIEYQFTYWGIVRRIDHKI